MRVCIIIELKNDSNIARLQKDVPVLISAIQSQSNSHEALMRSNDGLLFGFFVETETALAKFKSAITGLTSFLSGDSIILFEVGTGLDAAGFSRAWTWLQRHPATKD